jgi:four helix bundle protein
LVAHHAVQTARSVILKCGRSQCGWSKTFIGTRRFPADERFGLTSQIRKAAVSIPSNIGEGGRRKRRKAHLSHLDIALGSQGEVNVQLEIARRLIYISDVEHKNIDERVARVGRMLNGLIESLLPVDDEWN